jgi:23S rRNA pseudouridine1911/1915/1917 synthase
MARPRKDILHISTDQQGQTVGGVLRNWPTAQSWSQVRRLLASRRVMIDGNLCEDVGRRMRSGEVLKLLPQPVAAPASADDVRIVYYDAEVIVVDKPSGITSIRHPEEKNWSARRRQSQPTLTEILPRLMVKIERGRGGSATQRAVRAVHRLDRETSGLMVFARNIPCERLMGEQFRLHTITRSYLAIVHGRLESMTIDTQLVADRGDGRRGSTERNDVGKRAITHVRQLKVVEDYTMVECRLETGRTHQIRIHLGERGHAVCGDKVYGRRSSAPGAARGANAAVDSGEGRARRSSLAAASEMPAASRLALHAAKLGFVHPSGKALQFESPLPAELEEFWAQASRK